MRLFFLVPLLALPILLSAQFQLGWRTDEYAGINSALLNPANPSRTPYGWDLNLGEGTAFFTNNYAYLDNTNLLRLLGQRDQELTLTHKRDLPANFTPADGTLVYEFFDNPSYFTQELATFMGPSFSVRVAPQTRIGLFTRVQTMMSLSGIDTDLGFDQWQTIEDQQEFSLDRLRVAVAAWSEVGLNLNQGITTNTGNLTIGLSLRRLWGERGGYLASNQSFTLSKIMGYVGLSGAGFDIEGGFSENILEDEYSATPTGKGWGLDIGWLYQVDLGDDFYRWEFGGAVLNLGAINFTEAEQHQYNTTNLAASFTDSYENFTVDQGLEPLIQQFSQDVFNDALASKEAESFRLGLPTTLSLQTTYRFTSWAKVEATAIANISPFGPRLNHSSLVAITPRVDRHWWSVGLPVSLYAGQQLRLGLSGRLGPFFVGTDQLGALVGNGKVTGGDVYFGVKLHPLGFGGRNQKKKGKNRARRGNGKDVECYKF